jgi:23S rRNA (cytidine2498-2'-O)-methyltransferase
MLEEIAPGIVLCSTPDTMVLLNRAAKEHPIFVRHLAPAQTIVDLANDEQDIGRIATAIAALPTFLQLERGIHFAVQARLVQTDKSQGERPYTSGRLNQMLAEAFAEETGAVEDIKKPQVVVSLLCTMDKAYIGISTAEENLSAWPGGARHFAQTPEQISRAEFKFLEALESFGLTLPEHGHVLDLGAAPGGWTRLLLEAGLQVVAVDPARMDPRIERHLRMEHHRIYAERYLEEALRRRYKFDAIVNDMRMDARDAARLLVEAAPCLHRDGFILSAFKLPHATREINPLATLREGMRILQRSYAIVQARQLFHNRQEVTVVAAQPLATRT